MPEQGQSAFVVLVHGSDGFWLVHYRHTLWDLCYFYLRRLFFLRGTTMQTGGA